MSERQFFQKSSRQRSHTWIRRRTNDKLFNLLQRLSAWIKFSQKIGSVTNFFNWPKVEVRKLYNLSSIDSTTYADNMQYLFSKGTKQMQGFWTDPITYVDCSFKAQFLAQPHLNLFRLSWILLRRCSWPRLPLDEIKPPYLEEIELE